jgi:predicted nuclease with TOPRIM domain
MEPMTQRWTDDRMDDLKHQVDELGRRMEQGFAEQGGELNARFNRLEANLEARFEQIDERFEQVGKRFERIDERFERVDGKFEAIHNQIVHTQEMVISLHATLTRFSLGFLGAALVAVIAALAAPGFQP